MTNLRTKGKSTIVWILMGLLILGLGGFGVTSFSSGSSDIGAVGDTKVDAQTYARALRSEINSYSQQAGERLTMEQAQAIGLPRSVQSQLFTAAALEEEARIIGVSVGDNRVAQVIAGIPSFKGPNGKFDRAAYSEILSREGLSETQFEQQIRSDEARLLLHGAVSGGVSGPAAAVDSMTGWLLQTRDMSWHELTEADLIAPIAEPDDETLKAWHSANADRFTSPEKRKLSYVWLTPEMMVSEVELDETALMEAYEARIAQYRQPERRLVARLVFPSSADAQSAKDRLDAGELSFEDLVAERGLTLEDIDLGEVTAEDLGSASEEVFALDQPGIVGPIETDLGPAIFSMNAILEAIDVSFEEAKDELGSEASLDRAARMIDNQLNEYEDLLAGGASLEDVAKETSMKFETIEWSSEMAPEEQSIAGYPAFRKVAADLGEGDFPHIERLEDGGVFAVRLDEIIPPALIPFEEIRDQVADDWRAEELNRMLLARAEDVKLSAASTETPPSNTEASPAENQQTEDGSANDSPENAAEEAGTTGINWTEQDGLTRDGWVEGLPQDVIARLFDISEPDDIEIANAEGRVFLLRLDAIGEADMTSEDSIRVAEAVRKNLSQSLQNDIFNYYTRAVQKNAGISINQSAIDAINAQLQ